MTIVRVFTRTLVCAGIAGLVVSASAPVFAKQTHKAKLSISKAEAVALKKYKGGKIQGKTELENESGKWEYAVMVKTGGKMREVMVNADSGKIDSEEVVTPKEEAAEKKAEATAKNHTGKTTRKGH